MSFFKKNELNRILGRGYTKFWKCDNSIFPFGFETFSIKFVIGKLTSVLAMQDIKVAPLYVNDPELCEMAKDVLSGNFRWRFNKEAIEKLIKKVNCTPEELEKFRGIELRDWFDIIPKKV